MTREECEFIYDQGKEAVVAVLLKMDATITALTARVKALEDRLSKDSHNSSKPPSSDPPFKKPKSLKLPTERKSGGQHGHEGNTLRLSDTPDAIEESSPSVCADCGHCLSELPSVAVERRQVYELPPLRLRVTEHRAHTVICPACQCRNKGSFPEGVSQPVQYGPGFSGLCVYLQHYHLLPFARLSRLCFDVFGASVSQGTLWNQSLRCHAALAPVEEQIKQALHQSPVLHGDETSCHLGKKRFWLHTYCTNRHTYYGFHPKRGKEAMQEVGLLPGYTGTAVHDGYYGYFSFPCRHALCGVHTLRDLIFVYERFDKAGAGAWAKPMLDLLLEMKKAADAARETGRQTGPIDDLEQCLARYDTLIAEGYRYNPHPLPDQKTPFSLQLLDRLRDWKQPICLFARDVGVPFDNNQAERDLRMIKSRQKVSGCFRSIEGARVFCRIRGYLSTLAKQKLPLLEALNNAFRGKPLMPELA